MPSAEKLCSTSRTRSGLVNDTSAILATGMPWADSSTICARRQVTTDPVPRRTMRSSRMPSSLLIGRTCTRWTIAHLLRRSQDQTRTGWPLSTQSRHPALPGEPGKGWQPQYCFERDTEEPPGEAEGGEEAGSGFRRYGHSQDARGDLPQIVIGLAVTREGIPVRVWCWPGNATD